jgi:hypothetical protein
MMNFASPFAFISKESRANQLLNACIILPPKTDTNIVSINFESIKDAEKKLSTGDPVFCKKCQSVLNKFSKLLSADEFLQLQKKKGLEKIAEVKQEDNPKMEAEDEEKKANEDDFVIVQKLSEDKVFEINQGEKLWICEFCNEFNKLMLEAEEIPTEDDLIYLVQSANQGIFFYIINSYSPREDYMIIFFFL